MDVQVRPRAELTDAERDRFRREGIDPDTNYAFGYISDGGIAVSEETQEAIWRDGWTEMVTAGSQVCDFTHQFEVGDPQRLTEDDLTRLNEQARKLARSTQTLLAFAREEKGR